MTDRILSFNPQDPYPLVDMAKYSYAEAKIHSSQVDAWLGLEIDRIEAGLAKQNSSQELWIGLPPSSLLTPYIEFRLMLERIKLTEGATIIDCGAAYGRMGFVIEAHYPGVKFIGFELVSERVLEGERCLRLQNCKSAQMICADIDNPDFILPRADVFFIYDFSHRAAIDRLLVRLQKIAKSRTITVVARGRSSRDAIDHGAPWLSQVVAPEHFTNFSIYRSAEAQ